MTKSRMKEETFPPNWAQRPKTGKGSPNGKDFEVSVTELNSFQRCRRAWHFSSPSRMSLRENGRPNTHLNIGSCMHYALAAQTLGADPEYSVREFYSASSKKLDAEYLKEVGTLMSNDERSIMDAEREMCLDLTRAYFNRYGTANPLKPYTPIGTEITFRVPLVEELRIYLIGTVDEVAVDEFGNPVVVETKTYSRKPDRRNWRFAHQIYGYTAALQFLTGSTVPYMLYNGIRKTSPTVPQILKKGDVSKRWIDTTYEVYAEVLMEVYGEIPRDYQDILQRIKRRDRSPENAFFTRFRIPVSQHAVSLWWQQAIDVATEMAFSPKIYPNFPWDGCLTAGHLIRSWSKTEGRGVKKTSDPRRKRNNLTKGGWGIPIEELVVGDELVGLNEETDEIAKTKVVAVHKRLASDLLKITFANDKRPAKYCRHLRLTSEHPLYIRGQWVPASEAVVGDEVMEITDFPDYARSGREITKSAMHDRCDRDRGKASTHKCIDCGRPARDWSYDNQSDPFRVDSYDPRCRSCHLRYDKELRRDGNSTAGKKRIGNTGGSKISVTDAETIIELYDSFIADGFSVGETMTAIAEVYRIHHATVRRITNGTTHSSQTGVLSNGDRIIAIERLPIEAYVYNITCAPHQNYFVNGLLVHNCNFCHVRSLCEATQEGDTTRFDDLVHHDYHVETTHTRQATHVATPENVKNVSDIARFARKQQLLPTILDKSVKTSLEG